MLINPHYITIGSNVKIRRGARIEVIDNWNNIKTKPNLEISNNVIIEQNVHISVNNFVRIEENTLISSNVFITDLEHDYSVIKKPIIKQKLKTGRTIIGKNCFIGTGKKILAGVTIGENCIIGANSVVTKDIPAYTVAVGIPCKAIKRYDFTSGKWEKIKKKGSSNDTKPIY